MGTKYPIPVTPDMHITSWLEDRVQEIRWDLGLDLDTRPPQHKEDEDEDIGSEGG